MTSATTPGREPVQVFEMHQPFCAHAFGLAPCTATGSPDTKCYNTFATCRDTANFAFGAPLRLYFTTGKVAEMGIPGLPYVIPSLVSISTSPTRLNLASSNPDAQGLGNRALCSIVLRDHAHSDRLVDPYVEGRSWDPLSRERGSFWTRWLARNRYRQNIPLKVYEGYAGQTLDQMTCRSYFLQSIKGPNSGGRITIQGKDILARLEERKAQAPLASPGVLYADIDDGVTGFEVAGAVEADYPASGTLRIGGEVMTYTGRAASAHGLTFSGVMRGTDGTTPDSHSVDDGVQACLRYTNMRPDDLLEDLLVTHGGIDGGYLSLDLWRAEVDAHLNAYRLNALITEPTGVSRLVSEVQLQATCTIWWDEREARVAFKAIPGETVEYVAEDTTLYGRIHYVMAEGPDYPGYDDAPFRNCYVGDANGLLGDDPKCDAYPLEHGPGFHAGAAAYRRCGRR